MLNALDEAEQLGLDTVQVFTKNQQQWKAKPLDPGVVKDWRARLASLGWEGRTVSHASYLINLASPNDDLWNKSIDLMSDEIERCERLGVPFLVHHPGAHTTSDLESGLSRIAKAYKELFKRTPGYATVSCLENTVGSGTNIGRTFDELANLRAMILAEVGEPTRVGFCIDTCHAHAGGYDLSEHAGAEGVIEKLVKTLGSEAIRVLHLNDSQGAVGSRLDRHAHIGEGTIGDQGFSVVVNHPAFADKPKILETPKGEAKPGIMWDTVNLERLKSLLQASKTPKPARSGSSRPEHSPRTRGK